jgi:hypothetical protein
MAAVSAALLIGTTGVMAQAPGGGGRRNFNPAQFRQRMMDRYRQALEITKDDEWSAIEPLIQKVMDARRDASAGRGGRFMFRRGGRRGNAPQGTANNNNQGRRRRFGPPPSPEAEALQQALDAKASPDELKAKLESLRQARKAKQEDLVNAQDALRKVLTARQEAEAVLIGLLN